MEDLFLHCEQIEKQACIGPACGHVICFAIRTGLYHLLLNSVLQNSLFYLHCSFEALVKLQRPAMRITHFCHYLEPSFESALMAQASGMKTALSSGFLNPTAAEFVPSGNSPVPSEPAGPSMASGLSAALAAKIAAVNEQLRNPNAVSLAPAARPPKPSSKVKFTPFVYFKPKTHLSPKLHLVLGPFCFVKPSTRRLLLQVELQGVLRTCLVLCGSACCR